MAGPPAVVGGARGAPVEEAAPGVEHVRSLAADKDRLLSEGDIRDLNQIILKEPFWKYAEKPDGQSTRKEIIPGQYKTTPNNVRLPGGGTFLFASVEDTPPRMRERLIYKLHTEPVLPDEAEGLANKALAHTFAEIKRLSGTQE
ncbi:MAG: Fic protein [Prosthecobacter sp.]|nr:Fic protein [Prosthecobacter sp.]